MSIEIGLHYWETSTRPCDFSLNLETPRGTVIADFDVLADECVTLRRISFDGFGCCETEGRCSKMSPSDSTTLINSIREKDVNRQPVRDILCRYLAENASSIWADALDEHQLTGGGPDKR